MDPAEIESAMIRRSLPEVANMLDHPSNGSLRSPGLRSDLFEPISLQSQLDHFPLHRVEIPEGLLEFVGEGASGIAVLPPSTASSLFIDRLAAP